MRIIFVVLVVLGAIGFFFGFMFRMEPGEEPTALLHDIIVGLMLAAACFLGVHSFTQKMFRTYSKRFFVAAFLSVVVAVIIPVALFSWQKSTL